MATTTAKRSVTRGGGFLVESCAPQDLFTPADLSDDHKLIGQTAEEFVTKEVLPLAADLELHKEGLMAGLLKKSADLGLLAASVPEAYGGLGLDKVSTTIMSEKLAVYASFAVSHGGHAGIGTLPIVYFGTEEQKRKYLPKLASGEWLGCYCLSEPQAGSDAQNSKTRAVLSADGRNWILNGQKMWITNGGFADLFVVFAKVDGEKFSCFLVERGTPGFTAGAEEKKMGIKGSSTVPIFFENCAIPKENLLHEIGRGHIVAFNVLNAGRFSLGAYCLGGSKRMIEVAAKYAKERVAFGKPIAEFGLIRAKLAEMAVRVFAAESMVYRTAGLMDFAIASAESNGDAAADKTAIGMKVLEEYAIESSINKVYGSEVLSYVVDEAVQIFGGYGFHEDYPVARAYRDSRINRIFEGTNEINRMLVIQMLMKRALSGAVPLLAAGAKLQEEILAGPSFEEASDSVWADEDRLVEGMKKAFLLAAGSAMQKHREHLAEEQEIVGGLANIVMDCFAAESSVRRAQKAESARGAESAAAMSDAARVCLHDAAESVGTAARTVLSAVAEGDSLRTQLAVLRRFLKREPVDSIALRRRIADAVQASDRYPFEGR
jgi:alkylation response protein AidB-like acyl-CoA dehydrogenase